MLLVTVLDAQTISTIEQQRKKADFIYTYKY
jgi:hypothetical protein